MLVKVSRPLKSSHVCALLVWFLEMFVRFRFFSFYNSPPEKYFINVDLGKGGFFLEGIMMKRGISRNGGGGIQLRYGRRNIRPITISNPTQRKVIQTKITKLVAVFTSITNLRIKIFWGGREGGKWWVRTDLQWPEQHKDQDGLAKAQSQEHLCSMANSAVSIRFH